MAGRRRRQRKRGCCRQRESHRWGDRLRRVCVCSAEQNALRAAPKNRAGKYPEPTISSFQAAAANADWKNAPGYYVVLVNQPGDESWPITGASFILIHKDQADARIGDVSAAILRLVLSLRGKRCRIAGLRPHSAEGGRPGRSDLGPRTSLRRQAGCSLTLPSLLVSQGRSPVPATTATPLPALSPAQRRVVAVPRINRWRSGVPLAGRGLRLGRDHRGAGHSVRVGAQLAAFAGQIRLEFSDQRGVEPGYRRLRRRQQHLRHLGLDGHCHAPGRAVEPGHGAVPGRPGSARA